MILICVFHMLIKLTLPKHTNVSHYFLFSYLVSICFYNKLENLYSAGRQYSRIGIHFGGFYLFQTLACKDRSKDRKV